MGPFALWIFHFSSPCLLTVFGIYIRAQDVVLEIGTDMLFHVFKEMALKGLQFVSLGPWLNLTGAQSFSWTAHLTETKGPFPPHSLEQLSCFGHQTGCSIRSPTLYTAAEGPMA